MLSQEFNTFSLKDCVGIHSKAVVDLKWNFDGRFLSSASNDKTVKINQLETSGTLKCIQSISCLANQVCWHPEGIGFVVVGEEKLVEIWDIRSSSSRTKLTSTGGNINAHWSPCGNYIAIGNKNDSITVYDSRIGKQLHKLKLEYEANEFSWTKNSDYLLIANGGTGIGAVDLCSFASEKLKVVASFPTHLDICTNLKIDPTFTRMAMGSLDRMVSLWNLDDMICHHTISFESDVAHMAFRGDGAYIAVAAREPYFLICNSDTGECVARVNTRNKLSALAWRPASGSESGANSNSNILALATDEKSVVQSSCFLRLLTFASS